MSNWTEIPAWPSPKILKISPLVEIHISWRAANFRTQFKKIIFEGSWGYFWVVAISCSWIHEWRNLSFCMLISLPFMNRNASNLVWHISIWHTSRKHSYWYCRWCSLHLYEAQSCLILLSEISFFQLWATIFLWWSKNQY